MTNDSFAGTAAGEDHRASVGEAAFLLGLSTAHVAMLIDVGTLTANRIGDEARIDIQGLMAYKREMERRGALIDEMTRLGEEMGLYDDPGMRMPAADGQLRDSL